MAVPTLDLARHAAVVFKSQHLLKRINSLLCSVAYPILESAGALAPSRLKTMVDQG